MKLFIYLLLSFTTATTFAATTTAITVALEPDSTMVAKASLANKTLKSNYPQGYALDDTHHPHITLVQAIVPTRDLDQVYAAIEKALATESPQTLKLEAQKYSSLLWAGLAVTMIQIKKTDDLVRLQQKVADAVKPFSVDISDPAAFATSSEEPNINKETLDHARKYLSESVGKNYKPNLTVGVSPEDVMKHKLGGHFDSFSFSPIAVSVFQIGNFGTAHERLKTWK
jgi:hypothetical protein